MRAQYPFDLNEQSIKDDPEVPEPVKSWFLWMCGYVRANNLDTNPVSFTRAHHEEMKAAALEHGLLLHDDGILELIKQ